MAVHTLTFPIGCLDEHYRLTVLAPSRFPPAHLKFRFWDTTLPCNGLCSMDFPIPHFSFLRLRGLWAPTLSSTDVTRQLTRLTDGTIQKNKPMKRMMMMTTNISRLPHFILGSGIERLGPARLLQRSLVPLPHSQKVLRLSLVWRNILVVRLPPELYKLSPEGSLQSQGATPGHVPTAIGSNATTGRLI